MNKQENLPFRSFVPSLVASLEDADGMVRETAKSTIVELFRSVTLSKYRNASLTLYQNRA
jgi:hypothetical protein